MTNSIGPTTGEIRKDKTGELVLEQAPRQKWEEGRGRGSGNRLRGYGRALSNVEGKRTVRVL